MRISRLLMLLMLPVLSCALTAHLTAAGSLKAQHPVQSIRWDGTDTTWTVLVFPHTIFFPEAGPPGQYSIDDLVPDMRVAIIGPYYLGENTIYADIINFARDPRDGGNGSNHGGGHPFIGFITAVDPQNSMFVITRIEHQTQDRDVLIPQDCVVLDAPMGGELTPISFDQLYPGDPIMVHGTLQSDESILAEVIVRTDDWDQENRNFDSGTFEYFGIATDFFGPHYPHYYPGFRMFVVYESGDAEFTTVSKMMYPSGGMFQFPWGHLDFPPGALSEPIEISVSSQFMFWNTLDNIFFFQPHGIDFSVPVEIEIRYFNLDDINPDLVNLSYFDEDLGRWVLATHMIHYPEEHAFRGMIEHFSRYSLSTNNRPLEQLGQAVK